MRSHFFLEDAVMWGYVSYESGVEVSKRVLTTTFRDAFSESERAVIEIVGIAEKISETHETAPPMRTVFLRKGRPRTLIGELLSRKARKDCRKSSISGY